MRMSVSQPVVLKSHKNGIRLIMDPDCDFEELCAFLEKKLHATSEFFGNAVVALTFVGRTLSAEEERRILSVFAKNTRLKIPCVLEDDTIRSEQAKNAIRIVLDPEEELRKKLEDDNRLKEQQILEKNLLLDSGAHIINRTVKKGEYINADQSVLVLGSVEAGSHIVSAHNIIVLGGLYGATMAGVSKSDEHLVKIDNPVPFHYVIALDFYPESLSIGHLEYQWVKKKTFGQKFKNNPKIAYTKDRIIVVDAYDINFFDKRTLYEK